MGEECAASPRRTLLVASTGGHLSELIRLADHLPLIGEPLWVTFDSPQSRVELAGRDVEYVAEVTPRDLGGVLGNLAPARSILARHRVAEVISTGSAIALSFFPVARAAGIPCTYIESAARSQGPSMSGRLLRWVPGTRLFTQYPSWVDRRWQLAPASVFDPYVRSSSTSTVGEPRSAFVALGTMHHRFDRLVSAVRAAIPDDWEITWQTGPNDYPDLRGRVHRLVGPDEFAAACADHDVVIAHAGVGTALAALDAGTSPILVARRQDLDEHVDDHQELIAAELAARGLAFHVGSEDLDADLARRAARVQIETVRGRRPQATSNR
ncbi:glycosyltransferase [Gordonia soli]|uniref:Glycosyl transferase family 28 C-terminal domain-containing protein n=1 Tax=Gordonia soli NBRC 108243 TaxID=1223545 RepID=M0QJ87_9ACTN|nr:glycosyltransferase [Gordonia soli]GAC67487.1 hypothetical protein GS4_08_00710 [Gordonia soli NBRC 108243]